MILHCFYQSVLPLVIVLTLTNANFIQSSSITKEYDSKMGRVNPRNDPCSAAPLNFCKNNGICYIDGNDKFACYCRYPYIGKTCEEESECFNYCLNGGTCALDNSNKPSCDCATGWTGARCQRLGPTTTTATIPTTPSIICAQLDSDYCNTGFCVVVNNRARCQCPPTFSGDRCEIPVGTTTPAGIISTETTPTVIPPITTTQLSVIPPITTQSSTTSPPVTQPDLRTCAQRPCQNSRPCYNTGNSYYCQCGPAYTGRNCESTMG